MELEEEPQVPFQDSDKSQIITYNAPWNVFSLCYSSNPRFPFRLAIGSLIKTDNSKNSIEIIQASQQKAFVKRTSVSQEFPSTKLMFNPNSSGDKHDLLASTSEFLKIWKITDNQKMQSWLDLKSKSNFNAPPTSFDWNHTNDNLIGTVSIDTSCTIWDIEKKRNLLQFLSPQQLYDINFSADPDIFATAGANGQLVQFDIRSHERSVLYQTYGTWNRKIRNAYLLGCIQMDTNQLTLIDTRTRSALQWKIKHDDFLNAFCWSPFLQKSFCTVGDDKKAYIWNKDQSSNPLVYYQANEQICNLAWSDLNDKWLSICFSNKVEMLKI